MGHRFGPGSQHMMGYGYGNYGGIFFAIGVGVLLIIILFLVYKLIQKNKQSPTRVETNNDAQNILSERYAKGELTDEEYTRMKKILDNK